MGAGGVVLMLEFDAEKVGEALGKVVKLGAAGLGVGVKDSVLEGCEVHQAKVARFSTMEISMVLPDWPRTVRV